MSENVVTVQTMVLELLDSGMSEGQLANKVDSNQPTIHRIKNGSKTNYELGKKIEALYLDLRKEEVA